MSAYDPDKEWIREMAIGRHSGTGRGIGGLAGNIQYQEEQRRKAQERRAREARRKARAARKREEQAAARQAKAQAKAHAKAVEAQPSPSTTAEKPWSTGFAILGFLIGFLGVMGQSTGDPATSEAVVAGLIAGGIAGRFYRVILVLLAGWWALWALGQA